ncbi:Cytidylate kinase [Mycobacterium lentiflavum]|uniref:Cytidylate kinase n=1 Tax=Mycobacterium lentiflavum TaxID=141349 RepID=A0A0E4GYL8_MYCLN|nr:AAA family ATPase [Mycobacterium lentiflavum]CQD15095.1 Cytidylate kinase [Mycobacterium lentiflavum]
MNVTIAADRPSQAPAAVASPYIDVRETHTGIVVLAGDRAFKAKKPIATHFLDFRTTELRERACLREIELNGRLSPESYLGIAHLTDPCGGPAEPIVVMRRYREEDRLTSFITRGPDDAARDVLDTIADVLARFHARAERSLEISAEGKLSAVDGRWRQNLSELNSFVGKPFSEISFKLLARVQRLAAEFVSGRAALFARRVEEGCIVDGHGDLLADDIFWAEGKPALLDCLEFDDKLRHIDRIDDAAFLAMDLEFMGRKDLGDYFVQRYIVHSGDRAPTSLWDFYIAYRAVVRAKVDCIRQSQGNPEAARDAGRHLAIAVRHLEHGSVRMALVGGNPGTGKSTVAHALAETVGAQVISTDNVRRELADSGVITGGAGILNGGLYRSRNVRRVYEVALDRARALLGDGYSVILDGTWRDPHLRSYAYSVASEMFSAVVELMCVARVETAAKRILTRGPGNSEVTPEIAAALAREHNGWDTASALDTSAPLEQTIQQAHAIWRRSVAAGISVWP